MAHTNIQPDPFDSAVEIARVSEGRSDVGGIVSFTGLVRGGTGREDVSEIRLEHYPGMTEREIARVAAEAETRWPLMGCRVIHRYGTLAPGDPIVLVVTAARHRKDAFEAAEFLMDWLKTRAPFWKQERINGEEHWVEAKASDDDAAERWK